MDPRVDIAIGRMDTAAKVDASVLGTVVSRVFQGQTEVGAIYDKKGAITFAAHWDAPSDIPTSVTGGSVEELKTKLRAKGLRVG